MNKNKSTIVIVVVIVIVLIILFAWPRFADSNRPIVKQWKEAGIDCLPAHQNANLHFHPRLRISVDGVEETIPASVGNTQSCMAELHMHDTTGTIHVESVRAGKTFTLGQFFIVFRQEINRPGYALSAEVDGAAVEDPASVALSEGQNIVFEYTKL